VRRWQGPLINLAYRFFHDRARAEEMAQEAFLRAYRALDRWRKDAAFSTWLFAVATNLYRSEFKRIPGGTVSLDDVAEPRDSRSFDQGLEDEDRARAVRQAVSVLPPKYRDAMTFSISTRWIWQRQHKASACQWVQSRQDCPAEERSCSTNFRGSSRYRISRRPDETK
jgi:RNA polymerase sigma factor (sigma-70 family)